MSIAELLQILVCPVCTGTLTHLEETSSLLCPRCNVAYPIRDGIPVMLVEEAERIP